MSKNIATRRASPSRRPCKKRERYRQQKGSSGLHHMRCMVSSTRWVNAKGGNTMKVGFIGLGKMGLPMAINLLAAGHRVTVYNRTKRRADKLAAQGAIVADNPEDCQDSA